MTEHGTYILTRKGAERETVPCLKNLSVHLLKLKRGEGEGR